MANVFIQKDLSNIRLRGSIHMAPRMVPTKHKPEGALQKVVVGYTETFKPTIGDLIAEKQQNASKVA
jgi:hypothetical protein